MSFGVPPGGDSFFRELLAGGPNVPGDKVIEDIFDERNTRHAIDAIDYEDIDELADDDELPEETVREPSLELPGEVQAQQKADRDFDDLFGGDDMDIMDDLQPAHYDDDGLGDLVLGLDDQVHIPKSRKRKSPEEVEAQTQKLRKVVAKLEQAYKKKMVAKYFPEFDPKVPYNHHKSTLPEPKFYQYLRPAIAFRSNLKALIPKLTLEVATDERKSFRSKKGYVEEQPKNITFITDEDVEVVRKLAEGEGAEVKVLPFIENDSSGKDKFSEFSKSLVLATADWDDEAIFNAGDASTKKADATKITEDFLDDFSYEDDNIFDGQVEPRFQLNMNDPKLLFVPHRRQARSKAIVPIDYKQLQLKYNVSNDEQYDVLEKNYNTKIRSQLSNLNIEHLLPALRLQTPYYKIKVSKEEARAFHRAKFQVRQGTLICFSKLKTRKKKKDRGRTPQELFKKTSDLTAADSAPLVAMEYSEEYPSILSNFGMCSKVINYYRKERDDDNTRPKATIGETHVLGTEDKLPFWNFGHVAKGDFVPTLYNNMVRAPIFKHETKSTDFLLVRSQGAGSHQRYYLRRIEHLFAVGNLFPAVEVPAPHSRKVTNTAKNRLKMIVYRTMNNNGHARLSVRDISQHFPDQNDMQNRQRLKEFMEYQRHGDDQGYWKVKNMDVVPTEAEIQAMITPEDATLIDCSQHGAQVWDDIDTLFNDDKRVDPRKEKRDRDRLEDGVEDEQKERRRRNDVDFEETVDEGLTPWVSSRNFIIANQTKAMLQLNGEGDPTGIGLGFSLLRATQKHGFKPLVPPPRELVPKNTTLAWHQKLYEEEVNRIWYAQRSSLTADERSHLLNDVYKEYKPIDHTQYFRQKLAKERAEKLAKEENAHKNMLKITRLVKDENGVVQRRTEYISDQRLIKAYIKRKKQIEAERMSAVSDLNEIIPTNDAEMNKVRRKALMDKIANLQKRAKLSKGRKPQKDTLQLAAAAGGKVIDANTVLLPDGTVAFAGKGIGKGKSKLRRCALCGAYGHIRTKKTCPLYSYTQGGTVQLPAEQKEMILAQLRERGELPSEPQSELPALQQ